MEIVRNFFKEKAPGFYVSLASLVCALVALIVYVARGGDTQNLSPVSTAAVVVLVIALITNVGVLVKDFGYLAYVPYILYVVTFGIWLNSEMAFVSNVLTAIDNNGFDAAFIVMVVFLVLAIACGFAATVMKLTKPKAFVAKAQ